MNRYFLIVGIFLFVEFTACARGRLQQVREEVRSSNSSGSDNSDNSASDPWGMNDTPPPPVTSGCGIGNYGMFGAVLETLVLAPYYVPVRLLKDDYNTEYSFPPYPYANSFRGYLAPPIIFDEMYSEANSTGLRRKDWGVRLSLENGNDFTGLNRVGGQMKLENTTRLGILANWNVFQECLPGRHSDATTIGDVNLTARFAQSAAGSAYAGVGVRLLADRHQGDLGVNFSYGGDWFPVRPLVISSTVDFGTLGNAWVVHARSTVGINYHGGELFAGYDFLRIGHVDLQGPMVGVRWWF
jgi:hypothetical protein